MRTKRWRNIPGCISRELLIGPGGVVFDLTTGDADPDLSELAPLIGDEGAELVINFRSSGYYQPASMYGGPDRLGWPAEGDDERTPDGATLDGEPLPDSLAVKLFHHFENAINDEELNP